MRSLSGQFTPHFRKDAGLIRRMLCRLGIHRWYYSRHFRLDGKEVPPDEASRHCEGCLRFQEYLAGAFRDTNFGKYMSTDEQEREGAAPRGSLSEERSGQP